jgi:hypothetical protein
MPIRKGEKMPVLINSTIKFHTNDEDKDHDTHVTISVRDKNNVVCAYIDNDFGRFPDNSDNGPFGLIVSNPSSEDALQQGAVNIRIDPNGHDTWRFNFFLDLLFNDGSHLSGGANTLELDQNRREQSFGLSGMMQLQPAPQINTAKAMEKLNAMSRVAAASGGKTSER